MEKYQLVWGWRLSCIWLTQATACELRCISEKPNKTHSFSRVLHSLGGAGLSPRGRALLRIAVIFPVALDACCQGLLLPFRCPVPSWCIYGFPPLPGRQLFTSYNWLPSSTLASSLSWASRPCFRWHLQCDIIIYSIMDPCHCVS